MERVLQQTLHGPAERGFAYIIRNKTLEDDLARYANRPKYQRLLIDFEPGEDPDDAYSSVPYEKGANFLYYLGEFFGCETKRVSIMMWRKNKL
jgi:leukotriene-A4 hydrolase